jgi:copper chaperone CopZ
MSTAIICLILVAAGVIGIKSYMKRLTSGCCGSSSQAPVKKVKVKDQNPANYPYHKTLMIDGMTCESCANRVANSLNRINGVWARITLMEEKADIYMKTDVPEDELRAVVKDAGYRVYQIRYD